MLTIIVHFCLQDGEEAVSNKLTELETAKSRITFSDKVCIHFNVQLYRHKLWYNYINNVKIKTGQGIQMLLNLWATMIHQSAWHLFMSLWKKEAFMTICTGYVKYKFNSIIIDPIAINFCRNKK